MEGTELLAAHGEGAVDEQALRERPLPDTAAYLVCSTSETASRRL